MKIDVKIDDKQLKRALDQFSKQQVGAATVRALNKAAINVRTEAIKEVRQRRALKAKTVRDAFSIRRARKGKYQATVAASGNPIPLRDYQSRQTGKGVTVKVTPAGGRTLVTKYGNKGFLVNRLGGHVFVRTGVKKRVVRGRYAGELKETIEKRYGPSIPTAITSDAVINSLARKGAQAVAKRLEEELRYEIRKAGLR